MVNIGHLFRISNGWRAFGFLDFGHIVNPAQNFLGIFLGIFDGMDSLVRASFLFFHKLIHHQIQFCLFALIQGRLVQKLQAQLLLFLIRSRHFQISVHFSHCRNVLRHEYLQSGLKLHKIWLKSPHIFKQLLNFVIYIQVIIIIGIIFTDYRL